MTNTPNPYTGAMKHQDDIFTELIEETIMNGDRSDEPEPDTHEWYAWFDARQGLAIKAFFEAIIPCEATYNGHGWELEFTSDEFTPL